MRRALHLTGWIGVCLVLAVFFFSLWASLQVRQAVGDGALAQPVWSCLSPPDIDRSDALLADRAFIRGIQAHIADKRGKDSTSWHFSGLIAVVGAHLNFSEAERVETMRPMIAALPPCRNHASNRTAT